jgi:hypothetical protein
MRDFTLEKYEQLIKTIKENKTAVYGVKKWQELKPASGILLRHDVDRKPRNALKVAELEHKFGISCTYYFRITKNSFDETTIKRIYELGNEIGYHYEDLSLAGGDYEKAIKLFEKHLQKLRSVAPVETIAMHGRPFSPYDNRDLWRRYNHRDFGILAEAFLNVDYSAMYYLTDTGRTWRQTKANIRDTVKNGLAADVDSTDSLISFIRSNANRKIALVMHPERWTDNLIAWMIQYFSDITVNVAKGFLR